MLDDVVNSKDSANGWLSFMQIIQQEMEPLMKGALTQLVRVNSV